MLSIIKLKDSVQIVVSTQTWRNDQLIHLGFFLEFWICSPFYQNVKRKSLPCSNSYAEMEEIINWPWNDKKKWETKCTLVTKPGSSSGEVDGLFHGLGCQWPEEEVDVGVLGVHAFGQGLRQLLVGPNVDVPTSGPSTGFQVCKCLQGKYPWH